MADYAKKFLGYKAVVCGDMIEFYSFEKPFYAEYIREYEIVKDAEDEEKEKRHDNLTRARRNVRQIVLCNLTPHTKILTLTYAQTQLDTKVFQKDFKAFCEVMNYNGFKLRYLYVLERQLERGLKEGNEGTVHAHLIIFNDEIIPMKLLKKAWKHGRLEIRVLNGLRYTKEETGKTSKEKIKNAGAYLCKYLNKEANLEWGSRVYRCSKGLKRPIEHKFYAYQDTNQQGIPNYVIDDLTGFEKLRTYCKDEEYRYRQHIEFVAGDGKVVNNTIYCSQIEIKPENRKDVNEFYKTFLSSGKAIPNEKSTGKRVYRDEDEIVLI